MEWVLELNREILLYMGSPPVFTRKKERSLTRLTPVCFKQNIIQVYHKQAHNSVKSLCVMPILQQCKKLYWSRPITELTVQTTGALSLIRNKTGTSLGHASSTSPHNLCGWLMVIHWCVTLSGCRGWLLRCSNYFLYLWGYIYIYIYHLCAWMRYF